ncbi:MAG: hypothetical protein LBC75_08175 [Fibromonadaceae bacterium]|jgi:hypothetical protein|nr:hypothetical protein [Fibromonadaceae bacterium]
MNRSSLKIALAATLGIAYVFTFSCSSDDNRAGCMTEIMCYEFGGYGMESELKESCNNRNDEYLSGGCPSNWKLKCTEKGNAGFSMVYYYYIEVESQSEHCETKEVP